MKSWRKLLNPIEQFPFFARLQQGPILRAGRQNIPFVESVIYSWLDLPHDYLFARYVRTMY
jgi:hypothetical protein